MTKKSKLKRILALLIAVITVVVSVLVVNAAQKQDDSDTLVNQTDTSVISCSQQCMTVFIYNFQFQCVLHFCLLKLLLIRAVCRCKQGYRHLRKVYVHLRN